MPTIKNLTPTQAAKIIGVTKAQVCWLIRTGKLKARRKRSTNNQYGYEYKINLAEARRVRDNKRTGRPRGPVK